MSLLVIWCLLSVIAGMVAQRKHRHVWGWAIATFFLGVFTLIPLLCLRPLSDPADFKSCPSCGEQVRVVATVCKHCNSTIA